LAKQEQPQRQKERLLVLGYWLLAKQNQTPKINGKTLPLITQIKRICTDFSELCLLLYSLKIRYRQRDCYPEVASEWANASDGRGRRMAKEFVEKEIGGKDSVAKDLIGKELDDKR
jgi:hypothetical protein